MEYEVINIRLEALRLVLQLADHPEMAPPTTIAAWINDAKNIEAYLLCEDKKDD